MNKKVFVFNCPHCGKQNLVTENRIKLYRKNPVKCWVCQNIIPLEFINKKASPAGEANRPENSN